MVYQLASVCGVAHYAIERYVNDESVCKERLAETRAEAIRSQL